MFKFSNKDNGTTPLASYCTLYFSVSIVNFEHVNAGWVVSMLQARVNPIQLKFVFHIETQMK